MKKLGWLCFGMLTALCAANLNARAEDAAAAGGAAGARQTISETIDQLLTIVDTTPGEANLEKRKQEMRKVIAPKFDFDQMAQLSLGPQWTKCTPEERVEFVRVFSDLLAKTYLNRICIIGRGMVKIVGDKGKDDRALVRTSVSYKGDVFPLDYKLVERNGEWKVYDVIIENIGLVVNYRNEFAGIIRREQFSGLMTRLREKLAQPDAVRK